MMQLLVEISVAYIQHCCCLPQVLTELMLLPVVAFNELQV
jgi:hypothetical protein